MLIRNILQLKTLFYLYSLELGYISYHDLVHKYSVSINTVKRGIYLNRKGLTDKWVFQIDPSDKRKKHFKLSTIPQKTVEKYNLPTEEELIKSSEVEKAEKELLKYQLRQHQKQINKSAAIKPLLEAVEFGYLKFIDTYNELLPKDRFSAKYYAKEHAVWLEIYNQTGSGLRAKRGTQKNMFDLFNKLGLKRSFIQESHFSKIASSIRKRIYNNEPFYDLIIPKTYNNTNAKKTNDFHKGLVQFYYSDTRTLATNIITDLINHHCKENNQPLISESWVKNLINNDNVLRTLSEKSRYGKKYYKDFITPYLPRTAPMYAGNLWMIDGSPSQFYCKSENGNKMIRMYLVVILDVFSKKIVGFNLSLSEDRYAIMKALKMAITLEGHLPAEILTDNFSANKTNEIKEIKELLAQKGVIWRNSKVENPQDKSQVERFFGAFQSQICALYDDYLGDGITSKKKSGHKDRYYQADIRKKRGYESFATMKNRLIDMFGKYNDLDTDSNTPNTLYKASPKPHVKPVTSVDIALLFWKKTAIKVSRGMILLTYRKVEYHFEIYDYDLKLKYQGKKLTVRYEESDLSSIHLFEPETNDYICECRAIYKPSVDQVSQTEKDKKAIIASTAKAKSYDKHIDKRIDESLQKAMDVVGKKLEDWQPTDPLSLDKFNVNSLETQQMKEYYRQDDNTDMSLAKDYEPVVFKTSSERYINNQYDEFGSNQFTENFTNGNYDVE